MMESKTYGTTGRYITVNLTQGAIETHTTPPELQKAFVGGYGLGARLLYDMVTPGADPLGPDNVLGFITGPLTGTPAFLGSRYVVVGKSPLTGGWGDASSGGRFGPGLKFAGFDAVIVRGAASEPVYLWIENGEAELRSAKDLWGLDTFDTEAALQAQHGKDVQVASIGPAGERLTLIASVINERGRSAGRSGLGAVMGSKHLKAIVVSGDQKPTVADPKTLDALRKKYLKNFTEQTEARLMSKHGTTGYINALVELSRSPILNWGGSPEDYPNPKSFEADEMLKSMHKKYACWRCNQVCGGIMRWEWDGEEHEAHRPEYETMAMLGSNLGIDDLKAVMTLNEMCDRAGLDTISAGTVIGFAMECYQNGLFSSDDLDGHKLEWGSGPAAVALLERIIERRGIGDLLADGVMRASEELGRGSEVYAIHAGGQELPAHDPRQANIMGLVYHISPTPGRHTQGGAGADYLTDDDLMLYDIAPSLKEDQPLHASARAFAADKAMSNVVNAAGICIFIQSAIPKTRVMIDFLNAVTGWDLSIADCLKTGERIENVRLLFGLREGFNPIQVSVTPRAMGHPPLESGPTAGSSVDHSKLLAEYIKVMDWDPDTCQPSAARLASLGLEDLV
jgi:aldehyde:ferredoxin oxidoreductase